MRIAIEKNVSEEQWRVRSMRKSDYGQIYEALNDCERAGPGLFGDLSGPYPLARRRQAVVELKAEAEGVVIERYGKANVALVAYDIEPYHSRGALNLAIFEHGYCPASATLRNALTALVERVGLTHLLSYVPNGSLDEERRCLARLGFSVCGILKEQMFIAGQMRDLEVWQWITR